MAIVAKFGIAEHQGNVENACFRSNEQQTNNETTRPLKNETAAIKCHLCAETHRNTNGPLKIFSFLKISSILKNYKKVQS